MIVGSIVPLEYFKDDLQNIISINNLDNLELNNNNLSFHKTGCNRENKLLQYDSEIKNSEYKCSSLNDFFIGDYWLVRKKQKSQTGRGPYYHQHVSKT